MCGSADDFDRLGGCSETPQEINWSELHEGVFLQTPPVIPMLAGPPP